MAVAGILWRRRFGLFRMHLQTGNVEQMSHASTVDWFPHPDPLGEIVSYVSFPEHTLGHPANLPVELKLMTLGGGECRTIARSFGGQRAINANSWSPDGYCLAYIAYPVSAMWS